MSDVIIIGGGLAGCSAAIHLAKKGHKVTLYEAKTYPHHKVCGEFLSPECHTLLNELDLLPNIAAHHPTSMTTARITVPNGGCWETSLPGSAIGISRYVLDEVMVRHAALFGVDVREGVNVEDVSGSLDDGFAVRTNQHGEESAKVVIGAYGKRGKLDKTFDRSFLRQQQPYVGVKTHMIGAPIPNRVELHSFPGGYCGMSEVENGRTNVCLLVRQEVFKQHSGQGAEKIEGFIEWMQDQNPYLEQWFRTAEKTEVEWMGIAQVPFVSKRAVVNDVLMAGDSAGLIAPLAGDGMAMALHGGKLAAEMTAKYLRDELSTEGLRERYEAEWRKTFNGRLKLGRMLQTFMLSPVALTFGLEVVKAVPMLGRYFVRNTRDVSLATG
jgi:menaquinone-9 beta-reductase